MRLLTLYAKATGSYQAATELPYQISVAAGSSCRELGSPPYQGTRLPGYHGYLSSWARLHNSTNVLFVNLDLVLEMHGCLRIPEVLGEIFTHLHQPSGPVLDLTTSPVSFREKSTQPTFSDLSRVARTCKIFHGPSINLMWHSVALGNLLACLPEDLCAVDKSDPKKYTMRLLRPFREEDWKRPSVYTSSIRRLFSGEDDLKNITISPDLHATAQDTVEELSAISSFLRQLPDAESICVPQLDRTAMAHISGFPNLTFLSFDVFPRDWVNPFVYPEPAFTSLRTLEIMYALVHESTKFMKGLHRVPLTSFTANFVDSATNFQIYAFFSAISTAISHRSLSNLLIAKDGFEESINDVLDNRSLRLLFPFAHLTTVAIYLPAAPDIDDTTMRDLTRAWTLLETLELAERPDNEARVTLACLSSFAAYCPRLTKLRMSFDTTVIPLPTNEPAHRLETLVVFESVLSPSDVLPVAQFLSGLFPVLRCVCAREHPRTMPVDEDEILELAEVMKWENCWKEVEALSYNGVQSRSNRVVLFQLPQAGE
ncbi:hypothetical protein B0H14DRAFT_3133421 [Mycena olivaceomarginata]|nr:hypothetical protein B0H14DRAFT_3133421 [Mycena olivaceomarginata]